MTTDFTGIAGIPFSATHTARQKVTQGVTNVTYFGTYDQGMFTLHALIMDNETTAVRMIPRQWSKSRSEQYDIGPLVRRFVVAGHKMLGTLRASDIPEIEGIRVVRESDLESFEVHRQKGYVGSGLRYYMVHNDRLFHEPKVAGTFADVQSIIRKA